MPFQIQALEAERFQPLFDLSDDELAERNARRETVRTRPGTPCRISLDDAAIGESVILLNFEHQAEATPFRSRHAIYVRKGVIQAQLGTDVVPKLFEHRQLSLVRPAWAHSCGCKSHRELVTTSEVKRNCMRATDCGKEAWSVIGELMNKNRIQGVAEQGERAKNREAVVTKAERRRFGGCAEKECVLTWGGLA